MFRAVVEQSLAGMYVIPPDLQYFSYVNQTFADIFGYAGPEDIVGRIPITQFIDPAHQEMVMANVRRRLDGEVRELRYCFTGRRRDGAAVDLEVHGRSMEYFGDPVVIGILVDVTQHKRAEDSLARSQRRLARVVEGSDQGFWDWDLETDAIAVSPRFDTMLGYAPGEIEWTFGRWADHVHAEDLPGVLASIERHGTGASPAHEIEMRLRTKWGGWCLVLVRGHVVERSRDGRPTMMSGSTTDVTEIDRTLAELAALNLELEQRVAERIRDLQAKEDRLREALALNESILMTSAVGIAAYRQNGDCVLANPAFTTAIGGSAEQLLAQNFRLIASWERSGLRPAAEEVLATGEPTEIETRVMTTFGREVWMRCNFSRFSSQGEPHLLLMIEDVTGRKLAEEELRLAASVFDNSAEGVLVTDAGGAIVSVNPAFTEITGYSRDEAVGHLQPLVERLVGLVGIVVQRREVGAPEMARVGEPRPHDPPIARRDRLAAVAGDEVGDEDELVGEARLSRFPLRHGRACPGHPSRSRPPPGWPGQSPDQVRGRP